MLTRLSIALLATFLTPALGTASSESSLVDEQVAASTSALAANRGPEKNGSEAILITASTRISRANPTLVKFCNMALWGMAIAPTFISASSIGSSDEEVISSTGSSPCPTDSAVAGGTDYKVIAGSGAVGAVLAIAIEKTFGVVGKTLKATYRGVVGCCRNNLPDCLGRLYRKHHTLGDLLPAELAEGYQVTLRSFEQLLFSPEWEANRHFLTFQDEGRTKLAGYYYTLLNYYDIRMYKTGEGSTYQRVGALSEGGGSDVTISFNVLQQPSTLRNVWEISSTQENGLDISFLEDPSVSLSQRKRDRLTEIEYQLVRQNNKIRYLLKQAFISSKPIPAGKEDDANSLTSMLVNKLLTYKRNYPRTTLKLDLLSDKRRVHLLFPVERENDLATSFVILEALIL